MFTYIINGGGKESRRDSIIELFCADIPLIIYVFHILLDKSTIL